MKKILTFISLFIMILTLSSCGVKKEIKEKRETVSRIILNAQYCKKDIVMELRAYCRRPDIGRWLMNQA